MPFAAWYKRDIAVNATAQAGLTLFYKWLKPFGAHSFQAVFLSTGVLIGIKENFTLLTNGKSHGERACRSKEAVLV
jgi:hypothetical protein